MLGALIGAIAAPLIGGLFSRNEDKQNRSAVLAQNREQRDWQLEDVERDRQWFLEDRSYSEQQQAAELDRQVASRGIDFGKLRDQAVAAGFNPLSVLGNAGAYSTERGINLGSGGGGGVSFAGGGRGYAAPLAPPAMASAGFITDALERGIDTYFNTPPETDPLADALRYAVQQEDAEQAAKRKELPGSFGYDLTEQRAFSPAAVSGIPPVSDANAQVAIGRPRPNPSRQAFINVRLPDGQMGQLDASIARRLDINPYDTVSAGDWAEIRGEVVGEAESTIQFDDIARTAIRRTGLGRSIAPKAEQPKKKTKPPKMRDPFPEPGWMDELFR